MKPCRPFVTLHRSKKWTKPQLFFPLQPRIWNQREILLTLGQKVSLNTIPCLNLSGRNSDLVIRVEKSLEKQGGTFSAFVLVFCNLLPATKSSSSFCGWPFQHYHLHFLFEKQNLLLLLHLLSRSSLVSLSICFRTISMYLTRGSLSEFNKLLMALRYLKKWYISI